VDEQLTGREREVAAIEKFLDADGPRALLLEGEPGIGKTALWRHGVARALERKWLVLRAEPAEAEAELPFAAVGDLVHPAAAEIDRLAPPQRHSLRVALLLD